MKSLKLHIILSFFLLSAFSAAGQFANDWIEYHLTYYKIKVVRDGLYRVPYSTLSAVPGVDLTNVQGSNFNLYNLGEVVPIYVTTTGTFGPNDYIEFYGKKNTGKLDEKLFADPAKQHMNPTYSLFNDTAVYFLTWNGNNPNILIQNIPHTLTNLPAKEQYFMHTVTVSQHNNYRQGKPTYIGSPCYGGQPVYESIFDEGEGYTGFTSLDPVVIVAPLIHNNQNLSATLKAHVLSISDNNHSLVLRLGSYQLIMDNFTGFRLSKYNINIPLSNLTNYNNFRVTEQGSNPGCTTNNAIALVELTYPREFGFPGESRTYFQLNAGTGERYIEMNSFADKGTVPILYDLTNHYRILGQVAVNPLKFKLPSSSASGPREIFVTSQDPSDITTVTSLERVNFINYFSPTFQGDYVILTHEKLRNDGGNDYVNEYAQYRASLQGGAHQVEVVSINQLYDQFGFGIQKHPIAIRNFIDFALAEWTTKPEHLFIIGKAREYNAIRIGQQNNGKNITAADYNQCLVPTFGNPGSDILLTATANSIKPRVAVGRLSASNGSEIAGYLEKVKAYERVQQERGDPHQTIENKEWMKRVLHMGGGESQAQQQQFRFYLEKYERTIEDTLFGGNVYQFYKTSTSPIQIVQSDFIRDLINSGVSLITFFGHSSPNSFDIAIDDPADYNNFERYHLVLSNGCFTGNIFNPSAGISERFVLTPNKAAIGFISTISLSSSAGLDIYSERFYKNLSVTQYGSSIGKVMQSTVSLVEDQFPGAAIYKGIAEEMTLHGDPGIKLNPHPKPDYVIEPSMASFVPSTVSVDEDSFQLKVVVTNIGMAVKDSINVSVTRFFPNGDETLTYTKRIPGTRFSDTLFFTLATGSNKAFGLNQFCIKVDPENFDACSPTGVGEVAELSETNNELSNLTLNITADDIFPIHPYEFAIVPAQPVTLKASTADPFAPIRTYRIEIDTTELFNSPLKESTTVTQSGGVVTWTPSIFYNDSTVYYWRVGLDSATYNHPTGWHYSSFIFINNEYPGWNQSHYYQFLKDQYNNTKLDNDRIFKFIGDVKNVTVKTGTADFYGGCLPDDQIAHHLNGGLEHRWVCGQSGGFDGGIVIAVFDSATGQPWISKLSDRRSNHPCSGYLWNHVHGNVHCKDRDFRGFDFPTGNSCHQQALVDFINSIPNGNYILAYSVNNAAYSGWSQALKNVFIDLGSTAITSVSNNSPWAFFAQKGHANSATEAYGNGKCHVLEFSASFNASWYEGTITTPLIGPAQEWGSVHWKYHSLESQKFDQQSIDIIGVSASGIESVIYTGLTSLDTSIQFVDQKIYPYIRLRLNTRDEVARTPTQLDYWRLLYKKVPEAALHPAFHFTFKDSTLNLGEELSLSVAVENVTELPMDSLLVKYTLLSSGNPPVNEYVRYDSLRALDIVNLAWDFSTACNCLGDINTLIVEVNPDDDQPEQFHFNNIGVLTFKLEGDNVNPLLDVTFDGVHILDGDIVSAEPEIMIRLKDENKFLLLNDTSLVNVFIVHPAAAGGQQEKLYYDGLTMNFVPAGSGANNTAEVHLKRSFEHDGKYTLLVQAKDRSRNISGTYGIPSQGIDYRISFEVIRKSTITNVLNYPNPFTSSTRFVFKLTGVRPPDFFKIQIMTVSGKVVREITQIELGPLHIGTNITEFAWDGTDQYGDPLGNGVYLYRVVASIDGKSIEKMETSADKYFKSGFGKMYLAR